MDDNRKEIIVTASHVDRRLPVVFSNDEDDVDVVFNKNEMDEIKEITGVARPTLSLCNFSSRCRLQLRADDVASTLSCANNPQHRQSFTVACRYKAFVV